MDEKTSEMDMKKVATLIKSRISSQETLFLWGFFRLSGSKPFDGGKNSAASMNEHWNAEKKERLVHPSLQNRR